MILYLLHLFLYQYWCEIIYSLHHSLNIFNKWHIAQRWCMIKRNFQWTKCFMSIQLYKGVKPISEVTMTLAKILNFVFGRVKDF